MRRRWIWLGGLVALSIAFLGFVVFVRLTEEPPKVEDHPQRDGLLNTIVAEYEQSGSEAALALAPLALPEDEAMAVVFYTQDGESTRALAQDLRDLGIDPQIVGEGYIEAYVALPLLATASDLDRVASMKAIVPARPEQGSIPVAPPSPALQIHGVPTWQARAYTGQGIRVGIIDGGFDYYNQAVQAGEVPTPDAVRCYLQQVNAQNSPIYSSTMADCGGSYHGTAVAEALLDVAPDVTVYLAYVQRPGELRHAVEWLVTQDVDIINLSMGWVWDGPGNGTSIYKDSPLRTVDYAVQKGITWINSAGNSNLSTWYGAFSPSRSVRDLFTITPRYWHSFTGSVLRWRRRARCSFVEFTQGDTPVIQLRWEDNTKGWAERDLDLLVFDPQHHEFAPPSMGKTVQQGRVGDTPFEIFYAPGTCHGHLLHQHSV